MSSFHNIEIYPKDKTFISLKKILALIEELATKDLILQTFKIFAEKSNSVKEISLWDFNNKNKFAEELKTTDKYHEVKKLNSLKPSSNYAFTVELNLNNPIFNKLNAKKISELNSFPIFIIYLHSGTEFIAYNIDENTEECQEINRSNVNCFIKSSGRGNENLYGLGEEQEEYQIFYKIINSYFEDYAIVNFYD